MAYKCTKNITVEEVGANRLLVKTDYSDNSYAIQLNSIFEGSTQRVLYADVQVDRAPADKAAFSNIIRKAVGLSIKFSSENQLKLIKALGADNLLLVNLLIENGLILENMQV